MTNHILVTLLLAPLLPAAFGGTIGPDAFAYIASDATYNFIDISATGNRILAYSDDDTLTVDLGFTFSYYGQFYAQTRIGANGLMAFNGCEPGNPPVNFLTTATFDDNPMAMAITISRWTPWKQKIPSQRFRRFPACRNLRRSF
jgi:hypothetical protein